MNSKPLLLLVFPFAVVACGPPAGTRAHDDSAAGHRQDAAKHQAEAEAERALVYTGSKAYYNTAYHDHKRLAAAHLRAAQQLEADYATACEQRAPDTGTTWPAIASTEEVSGGAVVHLGSEVGSASHVLAQLECHRAALAIDGFDHFPDDPLAIEQLELVVHGEPGGTAVMFGVENDDQVKELRRRVEVIARLH